MMKNTIRFKISLAGYRIDIRGQSESCKLVCKNYMSETDEPSDLFIDISHEDIVSEESRATGRDIDDCTGNSYYESVALFRKIAEALLPLRTMLIHGSAIAVDDQVYVFIAPSGTGKSTHTRLWRNFFGERAVMVNDDKPLLKVLDHQIVACGNPWNGKHHLGKNISLPLKAICFLERNETNSIIRLNSEEGFEYLYKQSYHPENAELMLETLDLITEILEQIPVYKMNVNNFKEDAVHVSYEGMR